jgi:site-specific DNA recombinase
MKSFFGYIRVSTQKQGQIGVSLQEQRTAIERYARQNDLTLSQWFEERATAAKGGRPVFTQMLRLLKAGKVSGVVMHKIDRSARNLRDWTELGELIDSGVEVRFATESLDMQTRGGRLSADIQAVVAADYIRNLREEAKKGFYGRLAQGVYPLPAPVGYCDEGAGKPKTLDPNQAGIVRQLFELYASAQHTLDTLVPEAARLGIKNYNGRPLSRNSIASILNNPFYTGLIRITRTGETFRGAHEPLISRALFDRVQMILDGRTVAKVRSHDFLFRRMLRCGVCDRMLTGELQKGRVYYRCHGPCRVTGLREDAADAAVGSAFAEIEITDEEAPELFDALEKDAAQSDGDRLNLIAHLELQQSQLKARYQHLIDAYIDRMISAEDFEMRKAGLLADEIAIRDQLAEIRDDPRRMTEKLKLKFELAINVHSSYISAPTSEKRRMVGEVSSNLSVERKNLTIALQSPFRELANRPKTTCCAVERDRYRTFMKNLAQAAIMKTPPTLQHFNNDGSADLYAEKRPPSVCGGGTGLI